jgi:hypothetical protein
MEAHAGTLTIGTPNALRPRRKRMAGIVTALRRRLSERAERAHSRQVNGTRPISVPGSEHAHLIRRPRGF